MSLRLTFLGAAGAVTGSKYLLQVDSQRLLIDCELFQGLKRLRERNWQPLPFDPRSLGAAALYRGRCARGAGAAASGGTARDGRGRGPAARELLFGGASSRRSVDSHRGAG